MNDYRDAVIQYRKEHGITQGEFAEKCGLSRATINTIERNSRCYLQVVTRSKLDKILKEENDVQG